MLDPMQGTDILLLVTVSGGSLVAVASQRGLTVAETSAVIDLSSKDSRAFKGAAGRYQSTLSLQHLYVPTASGYLALRSANRNGTPIVVQRSESGSAVEEADAIVTSMRGDFPDQGEAVISVDLTVDGEWAAP